MAPPRGLAGNDRVDSANLAEGLLTTRSGMEELREEIGRRLCRVDIEFARDVSAPILDWTLHPAGAVTVNGIAAASCAFSRRQEELRDGDAAYVVVMARSGVLDVASRRARFTLRPGRAVLIRNDEISSVATTAHASSWSLRVDRAALEAIAPTAGDIVSRTALEGSAISLLSTYLSIYASSATPPASDVAQLSGGHIVDLLALAIAGERGNLAPGLGLGGLRAARRLDVLQAMSKRFHEPGLTAERLGAPLGLSGRYVRHLLQGDGAFGDLLNERRLLRAYRLLSGPLARHRTIADIAFGVGFSDLSYFNRLFRRRFGETPRAVRARG